MVERQGCPDWRNTFVEWVKKLEVVEVWDPNRNRNAVVKSDGNGGLIIKPTLDEEYPISPEAAARNFLLRLSLDDPPKMQG